MKIDYLEYLLALKRAGSINKSALLLHTSPQNVSRVMKQIEEEWGISLFRRTLYGVEFTEAGADALLLAENIIDSINIFKAKHQKLCQNADLCGELTIVSTKIESVLFVNDVVMQFSKQYPQVKINYSEDDFANALALLESTENCIGFLPRLEDEQEAFIPMRYALEYHWRKINKDQISIIVSKDSALSKYSTVTYNRLRGGRFVIYARNDFEDGFWSRILRKYIKDIDALFIASNGYIFYNKIIEEGFIGLGCQKSSPQSDTLHNHNIREQIKIVPIKTNGVFYNCLVTPRGTQSPQAKQFCCFVEEYAQKNLD